MQKIDYAILSLGAIVLAIVATHYVGTLITEHANSMALQILKGQ